MTTPLRCEGLVLFGIASDEALGTIEVKCRHWKCGYQAGVVILHTIDLGTGQVVKTRRFRQPQIAKDK